ncbi:hypothetical protein CCR75_005560 [Bremia lactucae]|uniref:Ubiquitinyl hydrolase 1 n=1 Tax=Bremia lactucae TaxID=4779 RepID=A0A976FLB4_BRELC|nr:hypothetical protein CCR75_005560 [Bremia lactucae]
MDTAVKQFRALLRECVFISAAAAASTDGGNADKRVKSVAIPLGLSADQLQYWNCFCGDSASSDACSLAEDLALLLASTNISTEKMISLLRVLLVHPSLHCAGIVRLVHMTFNGLKLTKRWDALNAVSTQILDAIYAKIIPKDTREQAFRFYIEVLVGFQHTATLYEANVMKLISLAELLSEDVEKMTDLAHLLQVACAALNHCHRGYEAEAMTLRQALRVKFGPHIECPTSAEAEQLLRDSAWVLSVEKMNALLPTIEGKWVVDDFMSDQQGSNGTLNAGSVLFRTTNNCFAHEVKALMSDDNLQHKIELTGYLFQQLPEMQVLATRPDSVKDLVWEFEGFWRQLFDENVLAHSVAPIAAPTWNCRACTMNNEASMVKCTTCGTDRPADVTVPTIPTSAKGSNPAPFLATFSSDMSFMRIKWSRGEQQGVWLARKQTVERSFDLVTSLTAASDAMMDSIALPAYVYSPEGDPENVLVLERAVLSTLDHTEFAVQLWMCPERSPCGSDAQIVLANGHDFELTLTDAGHLVWQIAGGRYSVESSDPVQFGVFCHVTLLFSHEKLVLLVDGSSAGEMMRLKVLDEAGPSAPGVPLLTIGGSFQSCDPHEKSKGLGCFYGQLLDLRLWSVLLSNVEEDWSIFSALTGQEAHLVGYYPLVGNTERLLMDLSKLQNHACVFKTYQSSNAMNETAPTSICNFVPVKSSENIPVTNLFAISLGNDFFGSGKFILPNEGANGLRVDCKDFGAALWRQHAVVITTGFQSMLSLNNPADEDAHRRNVVFAMCEASFWNITPLLLEATNISTMSSCDVTDPSPRYFDGSAMLIKLSSDAVLPGFWMYEVGLYIWSKRKGSPLSRVFRVAGGPTTAPSEVQIRYELPRRILSIAIGGIGVIFETAVDLELALQLKPGSDVRTGLIFPASKDLSHQQSAIWLKDWTFESLSDVLPQDASKSVLGNVYALLQPKGSEDDDEKMNSESETVMCTRVSTDGSAITQELYGCQTCNLVHGSRICRTCAKICHEGHELVMLGETTAACACHIRGSGLCRCICPIEATEYPLLSRPVNASLWGCNKCTVVNSIDLKQCNVCGNNAPEQLPDTGPVPLESTSTALALVKQPEPASDWSCEACTMRNDSTTTKCSICDTPRTNNLVPDDVGMSQESKTDNALTTLYHAAETAAKKDDSMSILPATSWICSVCTIVNQATNTTCYMCGNAFEASAATTADTTDVAMMSPNSKVDETSTSPPMNMDIDRNDEAPYVKPNVDVETSQLRNGKYLDEYKRTVAVTFRQLLEVENVSDSVWETTGGKMHVMLSKSVVGKYVRGTYVENDGIVRGLARPTEDGFWKFDGRFKRSSHSQYNACTLYWNRTASRFDGKWYRGDGSGDWKCLASPYASDFCGLAPIDPVKKPSQLQPYYSGMVNMKQNLTNVCYQNSFLQALYMTQDFRRLMLSCDAHNHFSSYVENDTMSCGNVVATIQELFAQLTASQRPFLATHALQRCLSPDFKNGRQQDASDFAHFIIDSLSQQLGQQKDTAEAIPSIFGGHQATILACKTCGTKSINREYFWELLLNMIDLRYTPITSITAVSGSSMDISTPEGYERLNSDLNKERTGAPYVYLCVKRCPEQASTDVAMEGDGERILPVTELVVKVASSTDIKPSLPGFERVELDLNVGGGSSMGDKKQVYLFFRREPNGSPITDLQVVFGNESIPDGFKQIQVDLNQGDGTKVYLCYRCDMPITDLKIVNSGIPGYRMVDHLLNVCHGDAVKQYLALKVGGNEPCLTDLKLVESHDVAIYEDQGWQSIGSPFSSALFPISSPDSSPSAPPQLMVRCGHGNPIFAIDVFRAPRQVPKYNDYEVIELCSAESSAADLDVRLKGDWMGSEETDRGRRAVRLRSVSKPIANALLLRGSLMEKGVISCIATRVSSWSNSITADTTVSAVPVDPTTAHSTSTCALLKTYHISGYWKNAMVPSAQIFDVELRPAPIGVSIAPVTPTGRMPQETQLYAITGTIGDGKGKPIAIRGFQISRKVQIKWPISSIVVLRGDECVPEDVQVLRETCSGRSGNVLAQTTSPHTLFLGVKREEQPTDGYITDICVIYGEIDAVPEQFTCIKTTPAGHSANLNDGTPGVPVFICFRRSGYGDNAFAKSLLDLALVWTTGVQPDTLPTGFTKIQHTPLGMEANLNQGTNGVAIYLCYSRCESEDIYKPVENLLNGEYEITSSPLPAFGRYLTLSVVEELDEIRAVEGNFGIVLHTHLFGLMNGILYTSKRQQTENTKAHTIVGAWGINSPAAGNISVGMHQFLPSSFPFELTLNNTVTEMDGWWSGAESLPSNIVQPTDSVVTSSVVDLANASESGLNRAGSGGKWKLIKDSYVHVAFKRDYSTEWKNNQLLFSERVWQHDIKSMLSRFVATRTLGGDNALSCSVCQTKTESRTHTVIIEPPEHLIITLKRMYYDWTQQKARKCLHDVRFPSLLTLPSLTKEEELAVYGPTINDDVNRKIGQNVSRNYGLYGVLVHSGLTADSGHYFSFCRESDESTRQLHLEDSPLSPWIKFNDTKVERSSWMEINTLVSNTVSDTVYLLLYKKISYDPRPCVNNDSGVIGSADDEEAMLLAKAMVLSMSAAKHHRPFNEIETKGETVNSDIDLSMLSTSNEVKTLLRKVEAENAAYLHDSVARTSSALHADDIHTLLSLRHSIPLQLRAILDDIC